MENQINQPQGQTEKCPKCKEDIQVGAKKCKHCGADLRNWFLKHKIITAILVLFLISIVISAADNASEEISEELSANTSDISKSKDMNENEEKNTEEISDTSEQQEIEQEIPSEPHFGDGMHIIGTDIEAGTYRTRVGSSNCYFARLSGFGGTIDDIIMNKNTSAPAVVEINENDKGFQSSNCGTWIQDLSTIMDDQTTFGDGILIVNTDIEPGLYKNSGSSVLGCYYSRLSGFGGDINEIIANSNTDSTALVTIAKTDKGFESSGCGIWTKQSNN